MHDMTDDDAAGAERETDEPRSDDSIRIDPPRQEGISNARPLQANEARDAQRQELELQLQKIRSEASAARLDAKAAEIELMIRRLSAESPATEPASSLGDVPRGSSKIFSPTEMRSFELASPTASPLNRDGQSVNASNIFQDWNDVRSVMDLRIDQPHVDDETSTLKPTIWTRGDAAHVVPGHHFESTAKVGSATKPTSDEPRLDGHTVPPAGETASDPEEDRLSVATEIESPVLLPLGPTATTIAFDSAMASELKIDEESDVADDEFGKRARPGAWLVSTLSHVAILVLLAAIGLTQHRPKDQVALTASAPSTEQVSMETFEIESSEPQTDPQPNEPNPSEVQYDLSPVGSISASELITEAPPAPPSSSLSAMLSRSTSASSSISMKTSTDATTEFCGVKGGGNHFVYLVDSSGSMGDAFDSARAELLHSIDLLKPEQRFYVIFFDAEPDYMRLTDAHVDEPRSVKATRVNRDALKRWAMRINKDRGSAPYEALRFALKLRPDVIFLLSDGEFPQGIEDLLKEENRVVNLFGDDDPISIVHTIGYYSKEGESRMKRIAQQNQGMYRHVPKP